MQGWRLSSLGAFLVTMAHDWSHNIDRKTVSNRANKNHAQQIKRESLGLLSTVRNNYKNSAKFIS